jgi:hypothetical protein
MDIHAHGPRHRPGATNGAWTTPNDFTQYTIQRILTSTTLLATNTINQSTISTQTFGTGHDAKCSVAFSTAGRATTSRFLVYHEWQPYRIGGSDSPRTLSASSCLDSTTTLASTSYWSSDYSSDPLVNGYNTISSWGVLTGISAGTHELALHITSAGGSSNWGCHGVLLLLVDLGLDNGV